MQGGCVDEYLLYYINSIDLTPYVSGSAQPKLNQKSQYDPCTLFLPPKNKPKSSAA